MSQYYHFKSTLTRKKRNPAMKIKELKIIKENNVRSGHPKNKIDRVKRRHKAQPIRVSRRKRILYAGQLPEDFNNLAEYLDKHQQQLNNSARFGIQQFVNQLDEKKRIDLKNILIDTPQLKDVQVFSVKESRRSTEQRKKSAKTSKSKSKGVSCLPGFLSCKPKKRKSVERTGGSRKESSSKKKSSSSSKGSDNLKKQIKNSKISWRDKVIVRYVSSDTLGKNKNKKRPVHLQDTIQEESEDNVVHLKIKVPKNEDQGKKGVEITGQDSDRIMDILRHQLGHHVNFESNGENDSSKTMTIEDVGMVLKKLLAQNDKETPKNTEENKPNPNVDFAFQMANFIPSSDIGKGEVLNRMCSRADENGECTLSTDMYKIYQPAYHGALIPSEPKKEIVFKDIGVSAKQDQHSPISASDCHCKTTGNTNVFNRIRNSIPMTESEHSVFDKIVQPSTTGYSGKRTKCGKVTVETHNPICDCEICTSFGTFEISPTPQHRDADVSEFISPPKSIRVAHNNTLRTLTAQNHDCSCATCNLSEGCRHRSKAHQGNDDSYDDQESVQQCHNCAAAKENESARRPAKQSDKKRGKNPKKYAHNLVVPHCCTMDLLQNYIGPPLEPKRKAKYVQERDLSDSSPSLIDSSDSEEYAPLRMSRRSRRRSSLSRPQHLGFLKAGKPYDRDAALIESLSRPSTSYKKRSVRKRLVEDDDDYWGESSDEDVHPRLHSRPHTKRGSCLSCSVREGKNMRHRRRSLLRVQPAIIEGYSHNKNEILSKQKKSSHKLSHKRHSQSSKNKKQPAIEKTSAKSTLEDIIRDLIKDQPPGRNPKMYTVTIGKLRNKPYTKIKIVNYAKPNVAYFTSEPSLDRSTAAVETIPLEPNCLVSGSCPQVAALLVEESIMLNSAAYKQFRKYEPIDAMRGELICDTREVHRSVERTDPGCSFDGRQKRKKKTNKLVIQLSKIFKRKAKPRLDHD